MRTLGKVVVSLSALAAAGGVLVWCASTATSPSQSPREAHSRPPPLEPAPTQARACPPSGLPTEVVLDIAAVQGAVRAVVREELQPLMTSRCATPEPIRGSAPPPPPRPAESGEALKSAQRVVLDAISTRSWGEPQVQTLRQLLPLLDAAQREEVFNSLFPAINNGEIEVNTEGPIF